MKLKGHTPVFILICLAATAVIWLMPGLCHDTADKTLLSAAVVIMAAVFIFGTSRIISGISISQSRFNALYFGMMGLRMLTALILIVIYLKFNSIVNKAGTIFLILLYFVYMGFEIRFILPKLRTDSEKSKNTDDARK